MLSSLGNASLGKRVTPPESPTGPEEEWDNATAPQPNPDLDDPSHVSPQERHSAITINEEPIVSPASECPTTARSIPTRGSVLKNPTPAQATTKEPPTPSLDEYTLKGLEQGENYIIDRSRKMYITRDDNNQEQRFHVEDFIGVFPAWPIIELSIAPTGSTKDEQMTSFLRCFAALFNEIKYVDNTAVIAPINIYDNSKENFIVDRSGLPDDFTKLGKWLMISGGSWVFDKKEKGNGKVFARFRLKSQENADEIITRVSFEFNRLGGSRLGKKTMQAMETETPMMLLFVCNGTDQSSIISDMRQMLDIAYQDIDEERMMPEQYENKDLPKFALRLNVPRLPQKKSMKENKAYDHLREHGKKAFHLEVAKNRIKNSLYSSRPMHTGWGWIQNVLGSLRS